MENSTNTLYYGDNLDILREHVPSASVDLIYLDPPFNSNRNYKVLFNDESGKEADAQITAFKDTWHWNENAERTYLALLTEGSYQVSRVIGALHDFIGTNQMMAYLVMMAARLVELHRVLKPTGSLYLHCDPVASHYLKILLDAVFGVSNFRNEIIWKRSHAHNSANRFGSNHDIIFFYSKTTQITWNGIFHAYNPEYVAKHYRHVDKDGRRYKHENPTGAGISKGATGEEWRGINPTVKGRHWAQSPVELDKLDAQGLIHWPNKEGAWPYIKVYFDSMKGVPGQDTWVDIDPINMMAAERLGYPTQKPLALLERILNASSNEGDVVLDPFCGCGTTIAAAQKLGRKWIGIDITHLAIALQKYRLKDAFDLAEKTNYRVVGEPEDIGSARQLASDDRYQFQWWALSLVKARPLGGETGSKQGKKGSDKGIDGVITFIDDNSGRPKRVIVQVKSGKVKSGDVRDLKGTLDREQAAIGIFITLESATKDMRTEAATAGFYRSEGWGRDYPRLQILTIEELLEGAEVKMPPSASTFKQAERESATKGKQDELFE